MKLQKKNNSGFKKEYRDEEEFYKKSPFAYLSTKGVIDKCDEIIIAHLGPVISLAPYMAMADNIKIQAVSSQETDRQIKEKILPKLLAIKKEFLKKQVVEKKNNDEKNNDSDNDPNKDNEDEEYKWHIKKVDKKEILKDENTIINHIIKSDKHGFKKAGLDKDPYKTMENIVDKVIKLDKQGKIKPSNEGIFKVLLKNVFGYEVEFRGIILNGELKVGTAFVPELYTP